MGTDPRHRGEVFEKDEVSSGSMFGGSLARRREEDLKQLQPVQKFSAVVRQQ